MSEQENVELLEIGGVTYRLEIVPCQLQNGASEVLIKELVQGRHYLDRGYACSTGLAEFYGKGLPHEIEEQLLNKAAEMLGIRRNQLKISLI